MAKYEDYAPKKRGFRLFEAEDVMPSAPVPQEEPAEAVPEKTAEEPRFCLRCTDTEMKYYRTLKFQLEGHRPELLLRSLLEDEDDPDSLSLLPLEMYVCPKCRRTELAWCLGVDPDGEQREDGKVLKYERNFERCTERQLRQVLDGKEFDEDMKQAARNLLERNFFGWK